MSSHTNRVKKTLYNNVKKTSHNIHFATLLPDLRKSYTYQARLEFQHTVDALRVYLLPLLLARQKGHCALCPARGVDFEIDHIVYNPHITLNELRALCHPCHKRIINFTPFRNRR